MANDTDATPTGNGQFRVEVYDGTNYGRVLTPGGMRMTGPLTLARARGIAAALNTAEGRKAFEEARGG